MDDNAIYQIYIMGMIAFLSTLLGVIMKGGIDLRGIPDNFDLYLMATIVFLLVVLAFWP